MDALADRFPKAVQALEKLFPRDIGAYRSRLDEIFQVTEQAWDRNLSRLKNKTIQYLLIAEAAPWTEPGRHPRYFYERLDGLGCILSAFDAPTHDAEAALSFLADRGFLLVDTLPFAMPYSEKKARGRPAYLPLIKASQDYFLGKLHDRSLQWSDHVRAALAFEVHGSKTIEAYSGGIDLPSGRVPISKDDIAVNPAHYTCAHELRRVFRL